MTGTAALADKHLMARKTPSEKMNNPACMTRLFPDIHKPKESTKQYARKITACFARKSNPHGVHAFFAKYLPKGPSNSSGTTRIQYLEYRRYELRKLQYSRRRLRASAVGARWQQGLGRLMQRLSRAGGTGRSEARAAVRSWRAAAPARRDAQWQRRAPAPSTNRPRCQNNSRSSGPQPWPSVHSCPAGHAGHFPWSVVKSPGRLIAIFSPPLLLQMNHSSRQCHGLEKSQRIKEYHLRKNARPPAMQHFSGNRIAHPLPSIIHHANNH